MRRLARTMLALLAIATAAFGRDTPISGGRLVSDLNANGFAITNLPSGFFPAETDPTVPEWAKADSPPASGVTTNDVCNIVTNYTRRVLGDYVTLHNLDDALTDAQSDAIAASKDYTDDAVYGLARWEDTESAIIAATQAVVQAIPPAPTDYIPVISEDGYLINESDRIMFSNLLVGDFYPEYAWLRKWQDLALKNGQDLTQYLSSREVALTNGLGLARLTDLPPLTNDVPSMISSAAQSATNYTDETTIAAISTNNPAFVAAVTNCPVVIAAADGTTLGEFGEYGTLGALLAALAAAITWLKTNKADASSLPYALVDVTVQSAPFVLEACFPIVYTPSGGSAVTIAATDAGDLTIEYNEGDDCYYVSYPNATQMFSVKPDGTFEVKSWPDDSLTFNGTAPTENVTQVLGFAQTYALQDRAINAVSLTESATLAFPQTTGKARDFVVRLTLTKTNNVVPSVTFPADVAYETEGGEWPDLTEAGTYIVRLTEVPTASESETARFFLQCSSAVADATPPSAGGGV